MPNEEARQKRRTLQCWSDMKQRCLNPRHKQYKNYGARGISVCDAWLLSPQDFLRDMGYKPDGMTIDRIDNDGNYEPTNCRWASKRQQADNQRTTVRITFGGETRSRTAWARKVGIHPATLQWRLLVGWPMAMALSPSKFPGRHPGFAAAMEKK
jgi:hypothetical protein